MTTDPSIPRARIEQKIFEIRGHNVMLDADLAELYGVTTGALNQAVKRNKDRFPEDFMFRLSFEEYSALRSQTVILEPGPPTGDRGKHRKYEPYAFTEQGVAMISSVLRSPRAVQVNVEIMRAFVQMRRMIGGVEVLSRRLDNLERKYDQQFKAVFEAIRKLITPPAIPKRRKIGFQSEEEK